MKVVLAPDSFKGTAEAADVAAALAAGWRDVAPETEVDCVPMADGGEGTLDIFAATDGAVRHSCDVAGPDGSRVTAAWVKLAGSNPRTGVIELALASGITLMDELQPLDAHTRGLGDLVVAALDAGMERLLIAIGGSASTDGGAGVLTALGARLLDEHGSPVVPGGRGLADVVSIDTSSLRPPPSHGVTVLTDVTNPLTGPRGAASVYGPQKGADAADVAFLDAALATFACAVKHDLAHPDDRYGVSIDAPGAGAAGGTGFGLAAWGAQLRPGAVAIADTLDLTARIASADLVVTGEGRFDGQSSQGKVVSEVVARARRSGTACALVAGAIDAPTDDFADAHSLTTLAGSADAAMTDTLTWLRAAGAALARSAKETP